MLGVGKYILGAGRKSLVEIFLLVGSFLLWNGLLLCAPSIMLLHPTIF